MSFPEHEEQIGRASGNKFADCFQHFNPPHLFPCPLRQYQRSLCTYLVRNNITHYNLTEVESTYDVFYLFV